jgi:long-chain acyl-CoA synthetase
MMGTVGVPLPGVDMRLEAVPELGYLPSDPKTPRGEVSAVWPPLAAGTQHACM